MPAPDAQRPFASRTAWDRTPNRLAQSLDARRRAGRPILDLTVSNPTRCGLSYPDEALRAAFAASVAGPYEPHPRGVRAAREAVARSIRRDDRPVDPDRLVFTAGTSEAYAFLFRLLADPGDEVLVPRPSYPLFDYLATLNDVVPISYPLRYAPAAGWRIDLEALRSAAGPRVRAVVAVHPNNPTGSFVSAGERDALRSLCRERRIALIADEVFAEYAFDPAAREASLACEEGPLTFALGGLSKSAGLPQMKLSWILVAGPEALAREALERLDILSDTYLTVGTPVQRALPDLLACSRGVRDAIASRVRANRRTVLETVRGSGAADCLEADGGWYAVLAAPEPRVDDETWAVTLLERDGVYAHPGHFYDFAEEGRLVISLLPPPETLREGLLRIARRADFA